MANSRFSDMPYVVYDADGYPRDAGPSMPLPDDETLARRQALFKESRARLGPQPGVKLDVDLKSRPRPADE